jgi:NADH-quinone oxidoreductase subunit J
VTVVEIGFYTAAVVALVSTIRVITNTNPVHALMYLVLSLLAVATVFFTIGAPFAGVLEIIIYAGAIMVLFVFVVMMLNLGARTVEQERRWVGGTALVFPVVLAAVLLAELAIILWPQGELTPIGMTVVSPKDVGIALFAPYLIAVELASMLLLGGLIAAYHLGRPASD